MAKEHHCTCGVLDFEPVILESIGQPPYELPIMACIGCGIVYILTHAVRSERHRRHLAGVSQAAKEALGSAATGRELAAYFAPPARAGLRRQNTATAKKAATKKSASKTPQTTRVRNQDRALVATMEDYEVKYLATKHGVTQKTVKDAVAKVGHSRDKVERELKTSKSS